VPPDLFVLLCDTTRADAFAPWGGKVAAPAMDRLCSEGVVYLGARAPAPWTLPSTASLFSGLLPTVHGITGECLGMRDGKPGSPAPAVAAHGGSWLPDELRARDYRTWGVSCNPWVSPWGGFDRGFDRFTTVGPWALGHRRRGSPHIRRGLDVARGDHGGGRAVATAARFLEAGPPSRPQFGFVNLMESHSPYDPPLRDHPSLRSARTGPGGRTGLIYYQLRQMGLRASPSPGYVAAVRSLYEASARYLDRLIGRFVELVEGRSQSAVVVVVSDHGENLGEHGLFAHNSSLHETLLRVPLVVWAHGFPLPSGAVEGPSSLLWLAGWLREIGGDGDAPLPGLGSPDESEDTDDVDGVVVGEYESTVHHMGIPAALGGLLERWPEELPPLVHQAGVAVMEGGLKYVATELGAEMVFDVERDPRETVDVGPHHEDALERFRRHRDEWAARRERLSGQRTAAAVPDQGPQARGSDEEMAQHLRSLGYIE